MTFLQPLLLWGLPLLAIPLIIHLMNRLRYRSVKWAAMIFLLKASRNSTSMAKIRQWLILLLRALAICALVTALARPLVGGWLGWSLSGAPDTVLVLLDRSASMGLKRKDGETLLSRAVSKISEAGMKTAPQANIILIDSATLAAIRIPSWKTLPNLNIVRPTATTTDLPEMFKLALDQLVRNDAGKSEIWIASDLQRSNWRAGSASWKDLDAKLNSLKTPPRIRLLALSGKSKTNRSITFVEATRHPEPNGREIREITYEIHSPPASPETEIPLIAGDASGTRQIMVNVSPGTHRLTQKISTKKENKELSWGFIKLPPDANALDDTLFYAFGTPPAEKAIVASDYSSSAALLALAAAPKSGSGSTAEVIPVKSITDENLENAAMIIVESSPDATFAKKLRTAAEKGAMVLFLPPRSTTTTSTEWEKTEQFTKKKPIRVTEWSHDDGILSDTPSGDIIPLGDLKILKRSIPIIRDDKTAILAFYSDGKPFLTRQKIGNGSFYHCSTLPIKSWSNLGDGMVIVPMERRLMKSGAARFAKVKYVECGLRNNKRTHGKPRVMASAKTATDSINAKNQTPPNSKTTPGVYSWDDETRIVNLPVEEVPNATLSDAEVAALTPKNKIRLFHENGENGATMQAEIWRIFLIAVLIALIAESLLTLPRAVVRE